jgi:hypothetical protein
VQVALTTVHYLRSGPSDEDWFFVVAKIAKIMFVNCKVGINSHGSL